LAPTLTPVLSAPAPAAPGRVLSRPDVLSGPQLSAGRARARLALRRDDPFFFDHPLDHVPGLLLLTALLDLVRLAAGGDGDGNGDGSGRAPIPDSRLQVALGFGRLCELDDPVELTAHRHAQDSGDWSVTATQQNVAVCEGSIRMTDARGAAGPSRPPRPLPIDQRLVHRADLRNVMLGELELDRPVLCAPLLEPPPGHFFRRRGDADCEAVELVEAARQLSTAGVHRALGKPDDIRILWLELAADLPAALPRSRELGLRSTISEPRANHVVMHAVLHDRATGAPLGSIAIRHRTALPATYAALRRTGRRS
jgi:hypothetical protein